MTKPKKLSAKREKQLRSVNKSLLSIVSAITQTPSKQSKGLGIASNVATAKIAGMASTAGIWGLVSSFGTAGTGTAISTLSGAAATSAALAWIGGLVGGGMAVGTIILSATGIAAGVGLTGTMRRKYRGQPRKIDDLKQFEQEALYTTELLLRPLQDLDNEKISPPSHDELRIFARDGLLQLVEMLEKHLRVESAGNGSKNIAPSFSETLKPRFHKQLLKESRALKNHAQSLAKLPSQSNTDRVLSEENPAASNVKTSDNAQLASVALAVAFQRLLDDQLTQLSHESDLVLEALRRSTSSLNDASAQELSNYVRELSPEQLRGVASNTKGIYHELLFAKAQNTSGGEVTAMVMEATNHPGADVQFFVDGDVVSEIQLKAVSSVSSVFEHLERYPDIEVLVTEEIAAVIDGIDSSGFSNAVLSRDVYRRLEDLHGDGFVDNIADGLVTSVFVTSSFTVWSMVTRKSGEKVNLKPFLKNAGIAAGTSAAIEGAIAVTVG